MYEAEMHFHSSSIRETVGEAIIWVGQKISGKPEREGLRPPEPPRYEPPKLKDKPTGSNFEQTAFVIDRDFAVGETVLGLQKVEHRTLLQSRLASHLAGVIQYVNTYGGDDKNQHTLSKESRRNLYERHFKHHRSSDIRDATRSMIEREIDIAAESTIKILLLSDFNPRYTEEVIKYLTADSMNLKSISKTLSQDSVNRCRTILVEDPRMVRHRERLAELQGQRVTGFASGSIL
jgi:hypothetical protein